MTLGHVDIIRRGAKLVDRLVIGVTTNPSKIADVHARRALAMVTREVAAMGIASVEVVGFDALLMHFAERRAPR